MTLDERIEEWQKGKTPPDQWDMGWMASLIEYLIKSRIHLKQRIKNLEFIKELDENKLKELREQLEANGTPDTTPQILKLKRQLEEALDRADDARVCEEVVDNELHPEILKLRKQLEIAKDYLHDFLTHKDLSIALKEIDKATVAKNPTVRKQPTTGRLAR